MHQENAIPTVDSAAEEEPAATRSCEQDFDQVLADAAGRAWLKEVWGKWPGDESIEELLAALKESR